jgi:hypothetical protein
MHVNTAQPRLTQPTPTLAPCEEVYCSIAKEDAVWFDAKMCAGGNIARAEDTHGPMALEASWQNSHGQLYSPMHSLTSRETDDVHVASSLTSGMLIQYLTICIAYFVLSFTCSQCLALVNLSTILALVTIQGLPQHTSRLSACSPQQQCLLTVQFPPSPLSKPSAPPCMKVQPSRITMKKYSTI